MKYEEMILKAKQAKSAAELLALAKENGVEMTEENANKYFEQLHKSGELSDEELDNVAGGGCYFRDGRLITTIVNSCDCWTCKRCGSSEYDKLGINTHVCKKNNPSDEGYKVRCDNCKYCVYEHGFWLCNHYANYI